MFQQLKSGFSIGVKTRNPNFLAMLVLAAALVPLMLLCTSFMSHTPISIEMIKGVGLLFWFSVAVSIYLVVLKSLVVYHQHHDNNDEARRLVTKFDVVVGAAIFALVVVPFIRG